MTISDTAIVVTCGVIAGGIIGKFETLKYMAQSLQFIRFASNDEIKRYNETN